MRRAAILAAGNSARAEGVKALFELHGETFLGRLVRVFREASVDDVAVVVGGPHADAIRSVAVSLDTTIVENSDPSEGPISSVRAAVASLADRDDLLLVHPVDIPGIRSATVTALLGAESRGEEGDAWIPSFERRRGHPVLLGARALAAVRQLPPGQTLRDVWNDPTLTVKHVSVDDPWCRFDVDTPRDYERLRNEHERGA